jgi:hypothetical protein
VKPPRGDLRSSRAISWALGRSHRDRRALEVVDLARVKINQPQPWRPATLRIGRSHRTDVPRIVLRLLGQRARQRNGPNLACRLSHPPSGVTPTDPREPSPNSERHPCGMGRWTHGSRSDDGGARSDDGRTNKASNPPRSASGSVEALWNRLVSRSATKKPDERLASRTDRRRPSRPVEWAMV